MHPRMRPRLLLVGFALVLIAFGLPVIAAAGRPAAARPQLFVPGELVVQLKRSLVAGEGLRAADASVNALMRRFEVSAATPLVGDAASTHTDLDRIYLLRIAVGVDPRAAAAAFASDPNVEFAEPNYIYRATQAVAAPNDPRFPTEWGLNNTGQTNGTPDADIDALEAWGINTGSSSVMVAVVDTGVDYTHPDLNDGRVRTDIDYDFANNDADAMDDNEHGTHVAGTIAAETNNGTGVAGVMWNAQILPVKVLSASGSGTDFGVARGIVYAAYQGADVINMSLGGSLCARVMATAVNYAATTRGVVVVAATGNESGPVGYPAKFAPVVAVAATDRNDRRASFSNYGPQVDVAAPGVDIVSTIPGGGYASFSGTSMATPHVAGVAGLLLSEYPNITNTQVTEMLRSSADDLGRAGFDIAYGAGRVNAYKALQTTPPSTVPSPGQASCSRLAAPALSDAPDRESLLTTAAQFRDEVLLGSPYGRALLDRFEQHEPELLRMLLASGDLRDQSQRALRTLQPALQALAGVGPDVTVTAEMVAELRALLDVYAAQAGPELRADLEALVAQVAATDLAGRPASEAWTALVRDNHVYLPLTVH